MNTDKISIGALTSAEVEALLSIYNEAFPPEERRPYKDKEDFIRFSDSCDGRFRVLTARENDGKTVAFISFWDFGDYLYVEHFAVLKEMRGRNLGSRMLDSLADLAADKGILLEVEPPLDETARRRISFYERHGFRTRPEFEYVQPPYSPGLPPLPLLLMTKGEVPLPDGIRHLRKYVYQVEES